jgi:hypothetical protein
VRGRIPNSRVYLSIHLLGGKVQQNSVFTGVQEYE